eukprot:sb/3475585/
MSSCGRVIGSYGRVIGCMAITDREALQSAHSVPTPCTTGRPNLVFHVYPQISLFSIHTCGVAAGSCSGSRVFQSWIRHSKQVISNWKQFQFEITCFECLIQLWKLLLPRMVPPAPSGWSSYSYMV